MKLTPAELKHWRALLTQRDAARRLQVGLRTYSRWESAGIADGPTADGIRARMQTITAAPATESTAANG